LKTKLIVGLLGALVTLWTLALAGLMATGA
jgi:hypothetical protein